MKVMVSACLLGKNCKYNGGNNLNQKVLDYIKDYEVIPICPETLGKLPVPRPPAEIVNGIVTNKEGIVVDKEFREGSLIALNKALEEQIDFAILKANSPSCGSGKIYDGTFSGNIIKGDGIFTTLLKNKGIKVITEKDL